MVDGDLFRWIVGGLLGVILLMLGGFTKWVTSKFRWLENTKANKDSTDKRFEAVISELKEQRSVFRDHMAEDRSMHNSVIGELQKLNSSVSNLAGRFEERR